MPDTPKAQERAARVRQALAANYQRTREGVRQALLDTQASRLEVPPRSDHVRSFVFAVLLPFSLLRLVWRDEVLRARFVARLRPPFATLLAMTFLLAFHVFHLLPRPVDTVVGGIGDALKGAYALAQDIPSPFSIFGGDDERPKHHRPPAHRKAKEKKLATAAKIKDDALAERDHDDDEDEDRAQTDAGVPALVAAGKAAAEGPAEQALKAVFAALDLPDGGTGSISLGISAGDDDHGKASDRHYDEDEDGDDGQRVGPEASEKRSDPDADDAWDFVGFIGALLALEWILVWIGREHHDAIAYEVSVLTGIPADALPRPPKLRMDPGYVALKTWRAIRFVFFVALAVPAGTLFGFVMKLPLAFLHLSFLSSKVGGLIVAATGLAAIAYWSAVFGAANATVAWEPPPPDWSPWFMRATTAMGRVPLIGWPFRVYARVLWRTTRKVWPACYAFELAPLESVAMVLGKLLAFVPGMYLIVRPFFSPAATHLILTRKAGRSPAPPT